MKYTLVLVLAAVAFAVAPSPARAGTYDVWSCAGPSGEPLAATGWKPHSMGGWVESTCGRRGGALAGSLNSEQVGVGTFARWTFEAPTNTTIASVTIQRTAEASGHYMYWGRAYFLFRDSPVLWEGYGLDVCVYVNGPCKNGGDASEPFSAASRFAATSIGAGRLIASAQCDGPQPCPAQPSESTGGFRIYRAQIEIANAFPPTFRVPPSGALLSLEGTVSGRRAVSFDGADVGGGLRAAEVIVDGVSRARSLIAAGGRCSEPFSDPVPCPLAAAGAIELDTSVLQNGHRSVQVALVDAAGNRTLSEPVTVLVHNDKDPNGTPTSRTAKLKARFDGRRRDVYRVGFGKTAVVKGRLVDGSGAPILGARLAVHARLNRLGEREEVVATVKTGANGRYRWIVPRGPSRLIRVAYRAYGSDSAETASAELMLEVRPKIALTVKPRRVKNRGRITFRGRLVGGPGKAGAQLTIEAIGRDVRNRVPVTTLRTDARGRFRFSYRFLRSFAPFTYRFRARILRQASYPYAAGPSRIVTVRILR